MSQWLMRRSLPIKVLIFIGLAMLLGTAEGAVNFFFPSLPRWLVSVSFSAILTISIVVWIVAEDKKL